MFWLKVDLPTQFTRTSAPAHIHRTDFPLPSLASLLGYFRAASPWSRRIGSTGEKAGEEGAECTCLCDQVCSVLRCRCIGVRAGVGLALCTNVGV